MQRRWNLFKITLHSFWAPKLLILWMFNDVTTFQIYAYFYHWFLNCSFALGGGKIDSYISSFSVILQLELASKRINLDFKISLQNICDCRALVSIPPLFRPVGHWPREGLLKTAWTQGRWQLLGQTRVPLHHSRSVSSIKWWKLDNLKYLLQASQSTFYNINILKLELVY